MSKQFILSGLFIIFSLLFYSSCRRVHLEQTGNWTQNPDNPGDSSRTNPVNTIREKTTDIIVNDPESDNHNKPDDPQESVIEQTNNMTGSDPEPDQDHPAGSDESGEKDIPTEQTPPDSESGTSTDDPPEELTNQQRCDTGETHVFLSENTQDHKITRKPGVIVSNTVRMYLLNISENTAIYIAASAPCLREPCGYNPGIQMTMKKPAFFYTREWLLLKAHAPKTIRFFASAMQNSLTITNPSNTT